MQRKEEFEELKIFVRKIPSNEREEIKILLKEKPIEYNQRNIVAEFEALSEAVRIEESQQ